MRKIKNLWKQFDDNILKGGEPIYKERSHDFKGNKQHKKEIGTGGPIPTREQYEQEFRIEPELRMQSRELRFKHIGYFLAYMGWFSGVVLFIMYRLRSDDLEQLEKEADDRIRMSKAVRELNYESKRQRNQ